MSTVGDIDYDNLANPIFDMQMSQVGGDYDAGDVINDQVDTAIDNDDHESVNPNHTVGSEEDEDYDDEDPQYNQNDIKLVLDDLQSICDEEGVNYTIPMENQVKAIFKKEAMCYSHLLWYVRGIITANQTQILPNINGAMSDMKMETKHMQQASNKLNKETASIEKVAKSLSKELSSIKEDIQESFRKSMVLFMKQMETNRSENTVPQSSAPPEQNMISSLEPVKSKMLTDGMVSTNTEVEKPDIPKPQVDTSASEKYLDEKIKALIKYGLDSTFVRQTEASLINAMYPDEIHAQLKTVKLTGPIKAKIRENIEARLEDLLQSDEE
ncbi:MAG: P protein [Coriander cytorhabdovirus 1]|nr:MAG: P protein [Coriander cytorhabdovirus 1]